MRKARTDARGSARCGRLWVAACVGTVVAVGGLTLSGGPAAAGADGGCKDKASTPYYTDPYVHAYYTNCGAGDDYVRIIIDRATDGPCTRVPGKTVKYLRYVPTFTFFPTNGRVVRCNGDTGAIYPDGIWA